MPICRCFSNNRCKYARVDVPIRSGGIFPADAATFHKVLSGAAKSEAAGGDFGTL